HQLYQRTRQVLMAHQERPIYEFHWESIPPRISQGLLAVHRLTIVSQIIVDEPQGKMRDDLQADISEGGGECKRALPGLQAMAKVTHLPVVFGHIRGDAHQPL